MFVLFCHLGLLNSHLTYGLCSISVSLAWEGRIVVVGFAGGDIPSIPANQLLLKNVTAMGVYWGRYQDLNYPIFSKSIMSAIQYYKEGRIRPHVGAVFKLQQVNIPLLHTRFLHSVNTI